MLFSIPALIIMSYLGGVISIASPCSGLMLPLFFANTFSKKTQLFKNTMFFSLGALVFTVPLGISFAYLILFLNTKFHFLYVILGIIFIVIGALTILGLWDKFSVKTNLVFKNTYASSFFLGLVSALSLGSCTGPILGLIITAGANVNVLWVSLFMFIYVLGIVTPFLLIALGFEKLNFLKRLFIKGKIFKFNIANKQFIIHSTNIISGTLFIVIGIIFTFYSASSFKLFDILVINYESVLTLQDKLIEFLINK